MKSHATLSYQIISERWDISAHIKEAVLHHHENVDGSGYPDGLEGAQQTMFTRILHVADVYDASEMLPWIRTFIGRIVDLQCSNKFVVKTFNDDLRHMEAIYGGETDAI